MICLSLNVVYSDILYREGQSRVKNSVVNTVPRVVTCSPTFLGILVQSQAL